MFELFMHIERRYAQKSFRCEAFRSERLSRTLPYDETLSDENNKADENFLSTP